MSDVDSIRWMASEHDLEFVDLETYGVDPAAGEILPASLARQYRVVAIKRKFGTPVVATADPDDRLAQETVREAIGRDFISVVASQDQIGAYLDQLFGSGSPDQPASSGSNSVASTKGGGEPEAAPPPAIAEEEPLPDVAFPASDQAPAAIEELPGAESETAEEEPPVTNGKRRRRPDDAKSKGRKSASAEAGPPDGGPGELRSEPLVNGSPGPSEVIDSAEAASDYELVEGPTDGNPTGPDSGTGSPLASSAGATSESELIDAAEAAAALAAETERPAVTDGVSEGIEPITTLLPAFGTGPNPSASPSTSSADQLAELALTVQDEEDPSGPDSAVLAADLVAEAVATFQEQQGDDERFEAVGPDDPAGTSTFPPLAKVLVDGDRVSLEDMEQVLDEHNRTGQSIARILTSENLVTEADLMWGMAEEMGLQFVDLDVVGIDYSEAGTIPESTARHHNVMVIGSDNGVPVVAASNPTDVFAMDDLRTIMGRSFVVVVATRTQISTYIGKAFNSGGDAADMAMEASLGFDGSGPETSVDDIQSVTEEAPIVRYVNLLILQALNERASDIHVEPTGTDLRIRYRIDGVLHDVSTAPRAITAAVTTRLKVMADMNVAEHRVPQDGRISLNVGSKGIDLRMATLPTIHGEKVVMRVLDKSSVVLGFADLGFDEDLLKTYESLYTKPNGTILVTGPTGSGKSTTLYTTLSALNSPEKNIITVEDPVELLLRGVNQVQLNVKAGLTFASALKSILRSDPDILLVGEIRDQETAVIAIEAALTGHMVLSTLHTNSAASTPMRLIEMGLEPFLVTSALTGVLAQRLARRLCVHCKEAYEPTEADILAAGWTLDEVEAVGGMTKVFRSVGCSACANTGYRGRKALSELMPMSEEIERLIIEGGSVEDIHRLAIGQGMLTLRQAGIRKAIEGETTLEEVLRVVA
jgi:type IV pilus assembly protein PilB